MSEFNLSDKIHVGKYLTKPIIEMNHFIKIEDVKEFIKRLKENPICLWCSGDLKQCQDHIHGHKKCCSECEHTLINIKIIDKLVGKKIIK